MKRQLLLDKLQNIEFCALLTALTTEECLEVQVLTGDGAAYIWMPYDDWNIYELHGMTEDKWNDILLKLISGKLEYKDLVGTDLERIVYGRDKLDYVSYFASLMRLPAEAPDKIYCIFEDNDAPSFFIDEAMVASSLRIKYKDIVTPWSEMNTEELEHWTNVYEECDGIPYCYFDDVDSRE